MYNFVTHRDIPKDLRIALRDLEGIDNVEDYSIVKINYLLNEYLKEQESLSSLKNYDIEYQYPEETKSRTAHFNNLEDAFVFMDRLTNYGKGSCVTLVLTQAGKPVRGYQNMKWIYPQNLYDR